MHLDLRTLSNVAGRPVAIEVAVQRLRQIAGAVFAEALGALDINTLRSDPARFHAAAHVIEKALEVLHGSDAEDYSR